MGRAAAGLVAITSGICRRNGVLVAMLVALFALLGMALRDMAIVIETCS